MCFWWSKLPSLAWIWPWHLGECGCCRPPGWWSFRPASWRRSASFSFLGSMPLSLSLCLIWGKFYWSLYSRALTWHVIRPSSLFSGKEASAAVKLPKEYHQRPPFCSVPIRTYMGYMACTGLYAIQAQPKTRSRYYFFLLKKKHWQLTWQGVPWCSLSCLLPHVQFFIKHR